MVTALLLFLMAAPAAPGTLVDVGGYRVHMYCTGSGSPTVMIIGGFSFDWALVQPEIAKIARVCTYDASGTAWSDRGPVHLTCAGRVDEIRRLLAGNDSAVLVGFSIGALFAQLYAQEHPREIAGMVIVDHAFLPAKAPPEPVVSGPDSPPAVIYAEPISIGIEDEPGNEKMPQSIRDLHRWAEPISPGRPDAALAESCLAELGSARLGELPLAVVSTTNDSRGYAALQSQLLQLSTRSRQFMAARSFHSIEISQPEVVIDAIRYVVEVTKR